MKKLMMATVMMLSFAAQAQYSVFPRVFNMGSYAQVQINNTNDYAVRCSGPVYLNTIMGPMESHYYFETIRAGGFSMRNFYLRNFSNRISYAHHSIFCSKIP